MNGIYLGGACDSEVIDNTITELYAGNGITLGYLGLSPKGTYTFIDNNTILGCKRHGISIELASNNTITRNTINGNGENGIMFFASSSNLVELNDIHFNIWDGIMIDGRSRSNEYYSNNIFENDIGISVFNSSFNEFVDNRIDISKTHGMFVVKSDSLLVKSNLIGSSWRNGIEIRESSNLQIISNHFGANSRATELYPELLGAGIYADTFNGIIENNDLWENHYYGIYVNRGSSIQINNNHVSGSGYTGISLHSISDITIYSNTLVRNSGNGIYLRSSNNSLIQTNIFSVNHQYGVNIDYTSEGTIARNNDFFENNLCPGFQANDDGVNNSFDHNYWSNWESEADYFLNGSAGSVDANPSLYALNIPSNSIAEPKVISPNGNERLENTVSVLWEAVHPMGYVPCTYCLFYSPDVGSNWVSVYERDFNPTRTIEEFTWDTTDLKNGDHYLFKVIAVLYTGYATLDTSDTVFSIKNGEIDSATSNISPDTNTTTVKTTTIKTEIEATTIWVTPSFSYLIVNVGMAMIFRFKRQKRKKNEVF